jgi:hypothetical protein
MTMASGRLLYATTSGTLSTVDFSGGLPNGTPTTIGGPTLDGRAWQSRALSVLTRPPEGSRPARTLPVRAGPVPVSCAPPAPVAQGTEQLSPKQQAAGSSPARGTSSLIVAGQMHRRALGQAAEHPVEPCTALKHLNTPVKIWRCGSGMERREPPTL